MCGVTENLEEHYISYVPRIIILLCQNCHRNEHKKASSDSDRKRNDTPKQTITGVEE